MQHSKNNTNKHTFTFQEPDIKKSLNVSKGKVTECESNESAEEFCSGVCSACLTGAVFLPYMVTVRESSGEREREREVEVWSIVVERKRC